MKKLISLLFTVAASTGLSLYLGKKLGGDCVCKPCNSQEPKPEKERHGHMSIQTHMDAGKIAWGTVKCTIDDEDIDYYLVGTVVIKHDKNTDVFTIGNKHYEEMTVDQVISMVAGTSITDWLDCSVNGGRPDDVTEFFELYQNAVTNHLRRIYEVCYEYTKAKNDESPCDLDDNEDEGDQPVEQEEFADHGYDTVVAADGTDTIGEET